MGTKGKTRGFTLVELMIVVAIIGILAAVGIASYTAFIQRSRNAEATANLADIRVKQEAYRATFHQYADCESDSWLPTVSPGATPQQWTAGSDATWRQLGVLHTTQDSFYFSYYIEAGAPTEAPTMDFAAVGLVIDTDNDFWYGAKAAADLDGDGLCTGFAVGSGRNTMVQMDEEAAGNCPE